MGVKYEAIVWNKFKKQYDGILFAAIAAFLFLFVLLHVWVNPGVTPETLIIRGTSLVAVCLLHVILIIGPLCRLVPLFLPLLYNRRHLGVTMFVFAAIHSVFSVVQFHALGDVHPLVSVFLSNTHYTRISQFPFQVLGFFAILIFFLMAITSHDFWLKNLGPKVWKSLHMLVYVAYALVLLHIALGILQYETHPIFWVLLVGGFVVVSSLHFAAGLKANFWIAAEQGKPQEGQYYRVCHLDDLDDQCAKAFLVEQQNIAVFKYGRKISAVSNLCRHQMGPLSEGRIVDGCITCPWHGYQYKPEDGQSPPPFTEKLETYSVRLIDKQVWVNPNPHPAGTFVEPATF
jgi:nitrite reductase/ring-hydroxylating ferredoxin subunit/DMSO/TMAO reductase YedYZ heme-binding membrane subunit